MNVRFLKEISEAYILDTELNILPNEIFDELYETVKYIRQYDLDLYNELYELDSLRQQQILKNYLDLYFEQEEILNEIDPVVTPAVTIALSGKYFLYMLGAITAVFYRKGITKGVFKVISVIGKLFESVGKFITRHGKYMQLRYSIIQENAKRCYIKCGIPDPNKISSLSYFSITTGSSFGTKTSLKQSECLRECYIEGLIEVIALHMESYFACLKKTGSFNVVQKGDSDDLMKMISSTNVAAVCADHYDVARSCLDNFYRVLELVYNKEFDEDEKMEWINKLRTRLYSARDQVQKLDNNSLQRYGQNQGNQNRNFQKSNFQRNNQDTRGGEGNKNLPRFNQQN